MSIHIISASRRTDIPAFYATWFMNRIRAGWCAVPNPFNSKQVTRVEFDPANTIIVFWTRWVQPLIKHLDELEQRGYRFYFQYTVINNPKLLDPNSPPLKKSLNTFRRLADRIGPERVIWRYDPVLLSPAMDHRFHRDNFEHIADRLDHATQHVVVSIVDPYSKAVHRLNRLAEREPDFQYQPYCAEHDGALFKFFAECARDHHLTIQSCAEEIDLCAVGIQPGKCIDDLLIKQLFGLSVTVKKDQGQRKACGCVQSQEIGMYDSCLFGCQYCYATQSFAAAIKNHAAHDPCSESLLGQHHAPPPKKSEKQR